jgi:imidazolonepropionase-like amidohydrolase
MYRMSGITLPDGGQRDVFIVDGRVTFEPVEDADVLIEDAIIMPGLVDLHAHLALNSPAGDDASDDDRATASARAHVDAGILALREPGAPNHASKGLGPDRGLPRTVTGGRFLAPPTRYFPGLAREVPEAELVPAALEELAHSRAWVKIIGDTPLGGDGITRTYSDESLYEVSRAVHTAGGRIAVHCSLPETINGAVEAGFDSLEHGTFMPTDLLASVLDAGIAWIPTLSISDPIRGMVRELGFSSSSVAYVEGCLAALPEAVRRAVDAGVVVLAGTDAGMVPHGMVRREVELFISAGVDPETAIGAASWDARRWLGLPLIEEGAPADLVAYRADPRDDPSVLAEPAVVVLDGTVLRRPAG